MSSNEETTTMLEIAIAGIDDIGEKLVDTLNSLMLLKKLIEEVNETENHEISKKAIQ